MKLFEYPSDHFTEKTYLKRLPREVRLLQEISDSNREGQNDEIMLRIVTQELTRLFKGMGTLLLAKQYEENWTLVHHVIHHESHEQISQVQSELFSAFHHYSGVDISAFTTCSLFDESGKIQPIQEPVDEWQAVPLQNATEILGLVLINTSADLTVLNDVTARLHFLTHHVCNELLANQLNRKLVSTDPLTGCYNRWFMDVELGKRCTSQDPPYPPFSVVLMDIDHFKAVNDHYGHREGDHCLVLLSEILRNHVPKSDHVIRMGGDEFLLLHRSSDQSVLMDFIKDLKQILQAGLHLKSNPDQKLTLSMGALFHDPKEDPVSVEVMLDRLDHALYESKRKGRDQITLWSPTIKKPETSQS